MKGEPRPYLVLRGNIIMIIAVWGSPGSGKSLISNALGWRFASERITIVVDTDMTQPTLPPRLPKLKLENRHSLGVVFSTPLVRDAQNYLHQHPKLENLFYCGLKKNDDYFSYEVGIRQYDQAYQFIDACTDIADIVVLDCSNQRGDPFIAAATDAADAFVIAIPPDIKNACWYLSVKPLFEKKLIEAGRPVITVASPVQSFQAVSEVESLIGVKLSYQLPFSKQLAEADGRADEAASATGFKAKAWVKSLNRLQKSLVQIKEGGWSD